MAQMNYKNYRVASFVAVNTGEVIGCSANMHFKTKYNGSGFVYDNSGMIVHSVSAKPIQGSGKLGGFFYRNSGKIEHCGFIGKDKAKVSYRDEKLRIDPSEKTEDVYARLGLDKVWKNERADSLEPDFTSNHVEGSVGGATEISSAEELLELIEAVNDGDVNAASGHYVLTKNISLGGKKIDPLGDSESTAFRGTFNGNGKKISNFVINAKGREFGGFFGVVKNATICNLTLDFILRGAHGNTCGGMVGVCDGARFENCAVYLDVTPSLCCGGFAGKNSGVLVNCYVCGKIRYPLPIWWLLFPLLLLLLLLIALLYRPGDEPYTPEIIDPNQVPVITGPPVSPPPAGINRISFELNQEVYIAASTQVGEIGYVNPARATMNVVIRVCVSDSALTAAGYDLISSGVRTADELASPDYDPDASYTELYRSGLIQIGYAVDNCKLSPLPGGSTLAAGDYDMVVMIDGYDPETNEKSIVSTQAPITVHIVNQ